MSINELRILSKNKVLYNFPNKSEIQIRLKMVFLSIIYTGRIKRLRVGGWIG